MVQVLIMNRILLFNCATPLIYVYFVLMFPRNYPKWASLLWCFFMGLTVDMFSNTPGLASASLTLAGALQPYLLQLFLPQDAEENMEPSARKIGWGAFTVFTFLIVFVFCLVFFSLEAFNFYHWLHWLQSVVGSVLLTMLLILTLESVRK